MSNRITWFFIVCCLLSLTLAVFSGCTKPEAKASDAESALPEARVAASPATPAKAEPAEKKSTARAPVESAEPPAPERRVSRPAATRAATPAPNDALAEQGGAPDIAVDATSIDMGLIPHTGVQETSFAIHNNGTADLVIEDIKTSCGCTAVKPDKKVIPPGESATAAVALKMESIRNVFQTKKTVTILSNDPDEPSLKLYVEANIEPEIVFDPPELDLGRVERGNEVERTVILRQASDTPVEVKSVSSYGQHRLNTTFEKRPQGEWLNPERPEYAIHISLPPDLPLGRQQFQVRANTTCRRISSAMYRVKANVESFYTIKRFPAQLRNPKPDTRELGVATVTSTTPFAILDLEVTGRDFVVSQRPGRTAMSRDMVLELAEDSTRGYKSETVSFTVKAGTKALKEEMLVRGHLTVGREPEYTVSPRAFTIGPLQGTRTRLGVTRIMSTKPVEIRNIQVSSADFVVTPAEMSTETNHVLELYLSPEAKAGAKSERFTFDVVVDGKSYEETVLIRGNVAQSGGQVNASRR